ncbi:MAG: Asp23/Gls24 family envelope stress response protein [Clostridia bacterium]|nr:Asp23/Gls24 family envelope stress response protein [Clostridia bacterium]
MAEKKKIETKDEIIGGISETSGVNVEIASNLTISEDVIGIIAGLAAAEVEGVSGMTLGFVDGINQILGSNKKYSKGVKIELEGNEVIIDLFVIVKYGVKIPDVAFSIQNSVKGSVETMTGLKVKAVNINVQGVTFEKDKEKDVE